MSGRFAASCEHPGAIPSSGLSCIFTYFIFILFQDFMVRRARFPRVSAGGRPILVGGAYGVLRLHLRLKGSQNFSFANWHDSAHASSENAVLHHGMRNTTVTLVLASPDQDRSV